MVHLQVHSHHEGAVFFVAPIFGLWQNGKLLLFPGMARLVLDSWLACTRIRNAFCGLLEKSGFNSI
jgi:hypothetical protein